ncbi:MAG: TlpA family protein disulfide reductase [Bacteroidales bacterium]|nr:TlpA family protein disulfide reductase [Bacteroidales bacterium]
MKRNFISLLAFLLGLNIYTQIPNFPLDTTVRDASEFNLTDLEGNHYNSADLKGDIVILNFWGIKCKPCVDEIPDLNSVVEEFNTSNVHFIGITNGSEDELKEFLKEHPFSYIVCPTEDYKNLLIKFNTFPAVPVHMIIDKEWKIVYRYIGRFDPGSIEYFKRKIQSTLNN